MITAISTYLFSKHSGSWDYTTGSVIGILLTFSLATSLTIDICLASIAWQIAF